MIDRGAGNAVRYVNPGHILCSAKAGGDVVELHFDFLGKGGRQPLSGLARYGKPLDSMSKSRIRHAQVPYAAAVDRIFPTIFSRLSHFGTPANALVLSNVLAAILVIISFSQGLPGAFSAIILLAVMSSLLPYALCALAEIMIRMNGGQSLQGAELVKVVVLGCLGFLYSGWAIYGAGADTVFLGTLLMLAGVPIHVLIKSRNARRERSRRTG